MLCFYCTGEKKPKPNPYEKLSGAGFSPGCRSPCSSMADWGPRTDAGRWVWEEGRGCAAACQPPAAACVHQMLANQTAPKLPTWLQLVWPFVYQQGFLWLALQPLGALQVLLLFPRLPLVLSVQPWASLLGPSPAGEEDRGDAGMGSLRRQQFRLCSH